MGSGVTSAGSCSALVERYRDSLVAIGHDAHTVEVLVGDVLLYANWLTSQGLQYDRVNLDVATSFVAFLRKRVVKWRGVVRPMKASTIRLKVSRAKRWYDFLRSRDYIYHNPFEGLGRIRGEKKLPEFLTEGEMEMVLNSIQGPRELLLCEMFYSTGGRISEVRGIDLEDIDWPGARVKLHRKGDRERFLSLSPPALAALQLYLPRRAELLRGLGVSDQPALFLSPWGRRWSEGNIREWVAGIGRRAGLSKYLHPHMFRHSFATHLLNGGANLREVQDLMDHADLSTTGIYLHVADGQTEAVHRRAHPRFSGSVRPSEGPRSASSASRPAASPFRAPDPGGSRRRCEPPERAPSGSAPDGAGRP